LKKNGHDVFPVNPHMQTFEGIAVIPTCWRITHVGDSV